MKDPCGHVDYEKAFHNCPTIMANSLTLKKLNEFFQAPLHICRTEPASRLGQFLRDNMADEQIQHS